MKDPQKVLLYPLTSEKAVRLLETENVITFKVSEDANKIDIKRAVEYLYDVKVQEVRVLRGKKGKKAYVKLSPEYSADELAAKLGVI